MATNTLDFLSNPSLTELLRCVQDGIYTNLRVAMPASIVSYDTTTHLAEVQPLLMRTNLDNDSLVMLPKIGRVPVIHPRTAKAMLLLPIARGDMVTLLVSDRSLDKWKQSAGAPVDPNTGRKHHMADCWAIPGGWPETMPAIVPSAALGALALVVSPGTRLYMGNGVDELLTVLDDTLSYIESSITFANGGGPTGPPSNASLVTALRARLANLKV